MKRPRNVLKAVAAYAGMLVLCVLLLAGVLRLAHVDLSIPFAYFWDGLYICALIKGVIDNGWYLHNPYLGLPGGLAMYDFPMTDSLHFGLIKLLSSLTSDFALLYNFYLLLTFPLTALSSLVVLRHFNISYAPAIVVSLLYAFLPCHFGLGIVGGLFMASYYLAPLSVMVMLWIYLEPGLLFRGGKEPEGPRFLPIRGKGLVALLVCLATASAGVYYAFFACYLLLVAGILAGCIRRTIYPILNALITIAIVCMGLMANLSPSFHYWHKHGRNPSAVFRHPVISDNSQLKIAQLVLPITKHRWHALAEFKAKYNDCYRAVVRTDDFAALGTVGTIGFLGLLGWLFCGKRQAALRIMDALSLANGAAILIATVGGFGSLFAFIFSTLIRVYHRINVYIAFFAFFAIALSLEAILRNHVKSRTGRLLVHGMLGVLLVLGVLDQTNRQLVTLPDAVWLTRNYADEYHSDAEFVQRLEASLPKNSKIFQLPYVPFPEGCDSGFWQLPDYDLFRGYLHSKTLRWSYATMKGRPTDRWERALTSLPIDQMVKTIAECGFDGIYIDRHGLADRGSGLECQLSSLLQTQPLVSRNQKLSFFGFGEYKKAMPPPLARR